MTCAIVLFAVTYILMLTFARHRTYIALGSAAVFIISGMLPPDRILGSVDFNVLMMIAGTMGLVRLFIDSRMPALLADIIMERVPNVQMAAVAHRRLFWRGFSERKNSRYKRAHRERL